MGGGGSGGGHGLWWILLSSSVIVTTVTVTTVTVTTVCVCLSNSPELVDDGQTNSVLFDLSVWPSSITYGIAAKDPSSVPFNHDIILAKACGGNMVCRRPSPLS